MRFLTGFATVCFVLPAVAGTANAAWECQGPPVACETSSAPAATAVDNWSYGGKVHRSKKAAAVKRAKRGVEVVHFPSGGSTVGKASYYWQGQRVASGGRFNPEGMTAAHRTLPFGTKVRVTNRANGKSVVVTINDRGPFIRGRIIDLSRGAARAISMTGAGVTTVARSVLGRG